MKRLPFLLRPTAGALCALLAAALGCHTPDESCPEGYKPYDCISSEPSDGLVYVKVKISGMNQRVPVTIFRGNYESGVIVVRDTLTAPTQMYLLDNGSYTLRARYLAYIGGSLDTVFSFEHGSLSSDSKHYCDGTCYSKGTLELNAEYP